MSVGENLSNFKNVQSFESKTSRGIDDIMNQIRMPYRIVAQYSDGKKHFLRIASARKIKLIIVKKEILNGNINGPQDRGRRF